MASELLEKKITAFALKNHRNKIGCAFVSGAEYKRYLQVAKSGDIKDGEHVKELLNELNKFGKIGEKIDKSSLGYCAEVVSTNRVLTIFPNKFSQVSVGRAIRPKTMQIGKKCIICRNLF